jgi:hypothetical protein
MAINHVITVFLYNCIEYFDKDAMLSFEQLFHELINYINLSYILILEDYQSQSSNFYFYFLQIYMLKLIIHILNLKYKN